MKKMVMPYIARALSSDYLVQGKRTLHTLKRKLKKQRPVIDIYIKADDPYSYLLLQALPQLESRFDITLKYHVFLEAAVNMYPEQDLLAEHARQDAIYLADLYELEFPKDLQFVGDETSRRALARSLVSQEGSGQFPGFASKAMKAYWHGQESPRDLEDSSQEITSLDRRLLSNYEQLLRAGHYLGAMIHYDGEWYWGLDRLDHLESRLIDEGYAKEAKPTVYFSRTYAEFCSQPSRTSTQKHDNPSEQPQALTLYWSARSPYSYIGLIRAVQLCQHYHIPLEIKPVLPMVMRGMAVPDTKKFYIFLDTKREAKKLGLPYGFVADPLGEAVERCYALVDYATSLGKLETFCLSFAKAVNAEGIRAETDDGMKRIVERCGMDWSEASRKLKNQDWQQWAQANLDEMYNLGCWGVPSFKYGDKHYWGQDRLRQIESDIQHALCLPENQPST